MNQSANNHITSVAENFSGHRFSLTFDHLADNALWRNLGGDYDDGSESGTVASCNIYDCDIYDFTDGNVTRIFAHDVERGPPAPSQEYTVATTPPTAKGKSNG